MTSTIIAVLHLKYVERSTYLVSEKIPMWGTFAIPSYPREIPGSKYVDWKGNEGKILHQRSNTDAFTPRHMCVEMAIIEFLGGTSTCTAGI